MATELALPSIQRGDTIPYTINFADESGALDMRGKTVVMSFKVSALQEDIDATLTKTIELAEDDAAAEAGEVSFRLERSESAELIASVEYSYSIRVIETGTPEPIETTIMYGTILVGDA